MDIVLFALHMGAVAAYVTLAIVGMVKEDLRLRLYQASVGAALAAAVFQVLRDGWVFVAIWLAITAIAVVSVRNVRKAQRLQR